MLLRSFGYALGVGALAIGAMTVACGPDAVPDTNSSGDPWSITASSETQSALGIQTWGFKMLGPGTLSVRGYDESHKRVVEVRQQIVQTDSSHWGLNLGVARSSSNISTLQLSLQARAAAGGTEVIGAAADNMTANANALKILAHLKSDAANRGASIGTSHAALTLSPTTLTGNGGDLTGNGGDLTGDGGGLSGDGGDLTGDGGDDNSGNNGNNGNNKSDDSDKCKSQKSDQCGGNMMDSLGPLLGALGSAPEAISAFSGVFNCAQGDGGSAGSVDLATLASCAASSQGDAGKGSGSGGSDPTSLISSVLSAFTSMQSTDQSCDCQNK